MSHNHELYVRIKRYLAHSSAALCTGQSNVLAAANISILYLSTYHSDFTMVMGNDLDASVAAFQVGALCGGRKVGGSCNRSCNRCDQWVHFRACIYVRMWAVHCVLLAHAYARL